MSVKPVRQLFHGLLAAACRALGRIAASAQFHKGCLVAAGCVLVLFQGQAGVHAAELPQVLTGVNARFDGAHLPVVTGNNMVINQFADKATLHWQSFNVGADGKVEFKQPSTTSVALNRIFDAVPSQVNGQVTANGQVYLINQNGIVFGPDAQVNTQSLVASTLDIDDRVYAETGFVNAINDPSGALPAFDSFGRPMGEIRLEEGAEITTAKSGRVLVFAPTIVNEGTIRTPEGQQVLAAVQDKVLIAASDDPNLRGLLVEVSTGGDVTNLGNLIAERGNISLIGLAVNQEGVARATTSVSLNGSVRLLARDMNGTLALGNDLVPRTPKPVRGGDVTLGAGSVTEVVPDTTPDAKGAEIRAVDAQSQAQSRVEIAGTRVRLESGSRVTATGGVIDVTAAANPGAPDLALPGDPANFAAELVVEDGAVVDASGDDTTVVSVSRNVVDVEARGNELADSPLQRDGPIRNETLQVDIRKGTDFLDSDGAAASIQRSAAERQSAGGTVRFRSEGDFVLADGATVDVSGGRVTYTDGLVTTSKLRQANGKVVDISTADPDQAYSGLAPAAPTWEAGYVEGKDAGGLTIQARGMELAGAIRAGATAGANQRQRPGELASATPAFARPWDEAPRNGALALTFLGAGLPDLVVGSPVGVAAGGLVLSAEQLRASGAGRIGLVNAGPVTVNGRVELAPWSEFTLSGTTVSVLADVRIAGGTLRLNTTNALVGEAAAPDATLLARIDGRVDLGGTWVNDSVLVNDGRPTAPVVLDGGQLVVDSGASIEVSAGSVLDVSAGAWRRADGSTQGGSGGSMAFSTGSVDTNPVAGARLDLRGELRAFGFEGGGSLDIEAERVRIVAEDVPVGDADVLLDGERQFALDEVADGQGERQFVLEIGAGTFQQGGFGEFAITSTRSDLEVVGGADVVLRAATLQFAGSATALTPSGADVASVAAPVFAPAFARGPVTLALSTTEDLANAIGPVADLRLAAGARIRADAGSRVSLRSETSLFVDGTIEAPAGTISLSIAGGPPIFQPAQMIRLGAGAVLDASGTALVDTRSPVGLRPGEVLAGGSVRIRADQGSVFGTAGSRIAVDGAVASIDTGFGLPVRRDVASGAGSIELTAAESLVYQGSLSGRAPAGFAVPAGRLTVSIDTSRRGVPSLVGADGIPRGPHTLVVGDYAGAVPDAGEAVDAQLYATGFVPLAALRAGGFSSLDLVVRSSAAGTSDIGAPVPDTPASLPVIEFREDLDLQLTRSIRLDAAVLRTDSAQVALAAPYVSIGYSDPRVALDGAVPDKTSATNPQETATPIRLTPTAGAGRLQVAGELIELVGESVTQGFGDAGAGRDGVVLQSSGDIRLRGVRKTLQSDYAGLFRTAGNLSMNAQRIYPTTLTDFEVAVEGAGGRIAIGGGGGAAAPLSVGGTLTLRADEIVQGGALFAPLGELTLDAGSSLRFTAGSLTSTSAAGVRAPFFRTEPGGALIIPAPGAGEDQVVFVEDVTNPEFERALPEKRIRLAAPDISLEDGSQFDLRGGSDVFATEFVPGPGGTRDILLADLDAGAGIDPNGSFAILPAVGAYAPYDPLETPAAESVQGLRVGDTLVLAEGLPGLPAGEYAILPARYALFGGYLVTPEQGFQDISAGAGLQRLDGAPIVAGRLGVAGGDAAAGRSQGFAIEDGERVRQRAEYLLTRLDELYDGDVLRAPGDAGSLGIEAGERLDLRGELIRGSGGGLGSTVDIATNAALTVVNDLAGTNGIELRALDLANLGADSLLLGGTRTGIEGGVRVDATSSLVTIESGVQLDLPELILAGDRIVVEGDGSAATRLSSSAAAGGTARLRVDDAAAVVAVSGRRLSFERASPAGNSGIAIAGSANLTAAGGMVVDATGDVTVDGAVTVSDGVLNLGAAAISIGATDGQSIDSGLVLSNADLAAIAGSDLRLRSRGLIDVYGVLTDPATGDPLAFGNLALDAQGIRGLANAGATALLAADTVTLGNGSGLAAGSGAPAAAGSNLRIEAADDVVLGDGAFALLGFESATLQAGSAVVLAGAGRLDAAGDLAIDAPAITTARAADTVISASGRLAVTAGVAGAAPVAGGGLGAALALEGADIDFAGRILLPSGTVRLTQRDDGGVPAAGAGIDVAAGAIIDVAGDTRQFATRKIGTPGGSIALIAGTGSITVGTGATLDVSGADAAGEAGELRLQAAQGGVAIDPGARLLAHDAAQTGGSLALDAARLEGTGNGVTSLNALLDAGGFRAARSIRLRGQDIVVDDGVTVAAREIRLVADTGRVEVAGTLDASGPRAGGILLAAGDELVVSGTLAARGTVAGADGGRVDLLALDADGDDADGAALHTVSLATGSVIDVSAGAGGAGGTVLAHVRRLDGDGDGDGQTDRIVAGGLDGEVLGATRAQLVATRVLRDPDAEQIVDGVTGETVTRVNIGAVQVETWRSETEAFLNGIGTVTAGPLVLTAGLQVESTGDLVLQERWNLMEGWYFGQDLFSDPTAPNLGLTGTLTLRAARNIELQADLTDAFAEQYLFGFLPFDGVVGAVPVLDGNGAVTGQAVRQSWGYRLAAGADLASADTLAVGARDGSLRLGEGVRVRTGTADIDIAATGNVRLESGAAIYTAGWDRGLSQELLDVLAPILAAQGITAYDLFGTFLNGGQFADGGGAVRLTAGGDLVAATAPGDVTAWLTRVGSGQVTSTALYSNPEGFGAMPTHWAVAYGEFRNGIAAFGGGDLRVDVGGDVRNVVLAAPTTGRVLDGVVAESSTNSPLQFKPSTRRTEILGGGHLELRSGGRLDGGQVLLGRGTATLRTAGGTGDGDAPELFIGSDANLDWLGGGSVRVGGLLDPTVAALSDTQLNLVTQLFANIRTTADIDNRFFTYTDGSRVSVASLGGDVSLDGPGFGSFLPPSLTAVAFGGDVNIVANPLDFFPAATGTLQLLAQGNVTGNFIGSEETRLRQSDQDRSLLPSVERPDIRAGANTPAPVPVHLGDTVPNLIVAVDGSIQSRPGRAGFWTLEFAKPTVMKAGTDISNVSVRVQHIDARSASSFQAGRDIVQGELRDNTGRFKTNDRRIFEIWGPGSAEFVAFRNISLGTSAGIESIGNSRNPALAAEGAGLRLLAGTGGEPAYDRFVDVYLSSAPSAYRDELNAFLDEVDAARAGYPASSEKTDLTIGAGEYAKQLMKFLDDNDIDVAGDDPVATFLALDRIVQRQFITEVLFAELEAWGTGAETPDRADRLNYLRGYTAMDTLFALADPLGQRAGDFAPGAIDAAVRDFLTITDPAAANAAQVALFGTAFPQGERKGDISLLLSQVQTLAGGGLSMLAPGGDINAGAADAGIIDKEPADLGIVTARGGDIDIAVDRDLLVNSTRVFALQGDLLIWSSNGNIDAGKGAKTVTSVPDPITTIDPNTGNTIIEFPPAVAGSGLQGENAALFAPRGAVNAGDAGIRTSGDLTIGAVEIVGTDNIDVGGVEIGFSSSDVAAVAPPGAASASSAATKGMDAESAMLGDANELGERKILGTEVSFISVEVLSFGDGENCPPGDEDCD